LKDLLSEILLYKKKHKTGIKLIERKVSMQIMYNDPAFRVSRAEEVEEEQEGLGKRENCIANHVILPTVEW
jgi:hypothetical protein